MPIDQEAPPAPAPIARKRATAEEIQCELKVRIARRAAWDGKFAGSEAPLPRPSRPRQQGDANWTVAGFPGLAPGCFGGLVEIVDQARLEYELIS